MKTKLFLALLCTTLFLRAQTTAIPDPIFEQVLINLGHDSGAINGSVLTSNIADVRELDLVDYDISDLTGIEGFTNLEVLECFGNNLIYLDVSNNTKLVNLRCSGGFRTSEKLTTLILPNTNTLEEFSCSFNALTTLDVSNFTNLRELYCHSNSLTTLDVSENVNLRVLSCHSNDLTFLDSKNGNNTKITSFRSDFNPNLSCIQVDDVNYANQNFTDIDSASSFSTVCEQPKTNVPDDNFEQALIDLGYDDILDNNVITSNINTVTSLNISSKEIVDLTGIEDFTNLEFLGAHNNNLVTVDLSSNTRLNNLSIFNNQLEALDVSDNTSLFRINCDNNQITTLDLSLNEALIDISCNSNLLTSLNIQNGNNINVTYLRAQDNPDLLCIQVDDVNHQFVNIGVNNKSLSEDCSLPKTNVPDDNFEQALIDLGYDDVLDNFVTTQNINTLTSLFINGREIEDLTGIEDFVALYDLDCSDNDLTSLDVSNNKSLFFLSFSQNDIATINLSENIGLEVLYCFENNLTNLDVDVNVNLLYVAVADNELTTLNLSNNVLLEELYVSNNDIATLDLSKASNFFGLLCDNNNLSELNLQNGNNVNWGRGNFDTTSNPNLTCIQVDDVAYANENFIRIDEASSFSEDCNALLSTNEVSHIGFSMYPNPSKGNVTINVLEESSLIIYSLTGKEITNTVLIEGENQLDSLKLNSGIYIFHVTTNTKSSTKRLVMN